MANEQQVPHATGLSPNPSSTAEHQDHQRTTQSQQSSPLFKLPAELRDTVYRLVLIEYDWEHIKPYKSIMAPTPGLLQTCHQLRQEGIGIYLGENNFSINVPDFDCGIAKYFRENLPKRISTASVSNIIFQSFDQANWTNLMEWLEAFYDDRAMGVAHPLDWATPPGTIHETAMRLVDVMFKIVKAHKDLHWGIVKRILATFRPALAQCDQAWQDDRSV